ncbi:MAG: hypothetical protein ACREJC_06430 [Tepidisphaeraceae bacterium]
MFGRLPIMFFVFLCVASISSANPPTTIAYTCQGHETVVTIYSNDYKVVYDPSDATNNLPPDIRLFAGWAIVNGPHAHITTDDIDITGTPGGAIGKPTRDREPDWFIACVKHGPTIFYRKTSWGAVKATGEVLGAKPFPVEPGVPQGYKVRVGKNARCKLDEAPPDLEPSNYEEIEKYVNRAGSKCKHEKTNPAPLTPTR